MEHAWKSLLRNVTFFWLLSQGWALKKKREGGRGELIRGESYNSRRCNSSPWKNSPRRHIVLKAPSWWWGASGVSLRQTWDDLRRARHVWSGSQRGSTNGAWPDLGCCHCQITFLDETSTCSVYILIPFVRLCSVCNPILQEWKAAPGQEFSILGYVKAITLITHISLCRFSLLSDKQ